MQTSFRLKYATTSDPPCGISKANARHCRAFAFLHSDGISALSRIILLTCLLLSACATPPLQRLALQLPIDAQLHILDTQPFPLLAAMLHAPSNVPVLRIYIEGDGHAWISPRQPSMDPSPRGSWFAQLALEDPQPSVWLARPCQYVRAERCQVGDWTHARFSAEALASLDQALDLLKREHGSERLELIGYSGGAALALLLAAQRDDVQAVQSLAGNLSPRLWVQQQKLSPLHGSLDPLDQRERLKNLPQRHMAGTFDRTVPANLAEQWRQHLDDSPCIQIEHILGLDHSNGWPSAWRKRRNTTPRC